jgi:hypothetical protein
VCRTLEEAGCPLAHPLLERLRFETLLAKLLSNFVNLPASQVDAQIEWALRRLVEFLGLDRGILAEVLLDQKQLAITHSYRMPGTSPGTYTILTM